MVGLLAFSRGLPISFAQNRSEARRDLVAMWTGGMMLIIDMNLPRVGGIRVDPAPLARTIQNFPTRQTTK